MKLVFLTVKSGREPWAEEAVGLYQEKLSRFISFEAHALKSKAHGRDQSARKVQQEEEQILQFLKADDVLILFDEKGKLHKSSVEFSKDWQRLLESGRSRLVILVGGAFGVGDKVKARANHTISLSGLTMNHWLAQVAALEQIYRAFCILKNIPYHNE